ncbi:hypothetical protein DWB77_00925 [Streptomyces hundungensis]|uniref:Uncharacterized protein n=1 Tax=Streptomyces hundungensis TaxID=1077946 RepID=A0A387H524_9ACTN|nr:DUF6585 family protein [Streptomyces hundungensis]AYG78816.1 hypothetical protein DWB77_00925 [Streptomyces hundungensis]
MTGPTTPRTCDDELLLARISAAAGRAGLGKRLATYAATAYRPRTRAGLHRAIRRLSARAPDGRYRAAGARPNARLDLYEGGMTVAVKGRIHIVRYDETAVFRRSRRSRGPSPFETALIHLLTDVERKRLVLHANPEGGDAEAWQHELRRAVTRAQLPAALAALHRGERVFFAGIWLTTEHIGFRDLRLPWPQVQRIGMSGGFLTVTVGGRRHRLGPEASTIPNVFVLRTLAECCRAGGSGVADGG